MRVHGLLYGVLVVGRRHPSAVGQPVQRPDELGAQEEQKAEGQEEEEDSDGRRGHRRRRSVANAARLVAPASSPSVPVVSSRPRPLPPRTRLHPTTTGRVARPRILPPTPKNRIRWIMFDV